MRNQGQEGAQAERWTMPVFDLPSQSTQQRVRAIRELDSRGIAGTPIYLLCWLSITYFNGIWASHPAATALAAAALAVILAVRLVLHARLATLLESNPDRARAVLCTAVLSATTIFGLLTAWSMVDPRLHSIFTYMALACAVLGTVASIILSIDPVLRTFIPLTSMGPLAVAIFFTANMETITLAGLILINLAYIFKASGHGHRDYWNWMSAQDSLLRQTVDLDAQARTDPLTGLWNRAGLDRRIRELGAGQHPTSLTVLLLDIDHFKQVNDVHGHAAGDTCLVEIGRCVRSAVRDSDFVARYGGEEFVVLLADAPLDISIEIAEKIRTCVAAHAIGLDAGMIHITCSIGLAHSGMDATDNLHGLLARADQALYVAKSEGRNRVSIADSPVRS